MPWRSNKLQPFSLQGSASVSDGNSDSGKRSLFHGSAVDDTWSEISGDQAGSNFDLEGIPTWDEESGLADNASVLGAKRISRGRTLEDSKYAQMLSNAFISCKEVDEFRFPWECGHLKPFFESDRDSNEIDKDFLSVKADWVGLDWQSDPVAPPPAQFGPQLGEDGIFHTKAILAMPDKTFEEQNLALTELAVNKWVSIVSACLLASETGRLIINLGSLEAQKDGAQRIVQSIIGTRSPRTACARANSMLNFMRWAFEESPEVVQPFDEERVWRYLCHLQDNSAAATKGASFVSACRYSCHVFGFECLGKVCNSQRVQGVANLMYVGKRPLRQCLVLTVEQVRFLHSMLEDPKADVFDKAICSYVLIALYGRCRHSDLGHIHDVTHDHSEEGGFCEIRTKHHKTARTISLKATLLPIILPGLNVNGAPWIGVAKMALEQVGLCFDGLIDGPVMKPPNRGGLCQRGIASTEITKFLRLCFEDGKEVSPLESRVSSHSLKATMLSWGGKYGLSPADQATLGRHSSVWSESSAIYSRDASIRAVRRLQEIILAIARQEFNPDAPRSAYFKDAKTTEVATVGQTGESAVWIKDESDDGGSISDGSASDEDESEVDEPPPPKCIRVNLAQLETSHFWKHRQSKVVHYCESFTVAKADAGVVFGCGRAVNSNFHGTKEFDSTWMCKMCKAKALKDGALGPKRKD